jgi:hypothetical protein
VLSSALRAIAELRTAPSEAPCDAVKKSLDAAPEPVNPKLFQRIKALSKRSLKPARGGRNDSIIDAWMELSAPKKFP